MRLTVKNIVSSVASDSTANGVCDLIESLVNCENTAALTSILSGAAMPILLPAVALCGSELLRTRGDRQRHTELNTHCDAVTAQLRQIESKQDAAADQLTQLLERNTFVWARLSGADQKRFAQLVTGEVLKRLSELNLATDEHIDNLLVYHETTLFKIDQLQDSFDDIARTITEKYERSEQDLRSMVDDRDREIQRLANALEQALVAAQAGDTDAERAIRLARATGDADLLQKTIARLARQERQCQLDRRQKEDAIYLERAREVAAIAFLRGDITEAEHWFNQILDLIPNDRYSINRLGNIARLRGQLDKAEKLYRQVLSLSPDELPWRAGALGNLGTIALIHGKLDEAEKFHREALDINRQLGNLEVQANTLGNLGNVAQNRGELDKAEKLYREALDIDRQLGRLKGQASSLGNLGILNLIQGDFDRADTLFREALEINQQLGNLEVQANTLGNLGINAKNRGDLDQAEKLHLEALEIDRQLGSLEGQASDLSNLGVIAQNRGDLDQAEKLYRQALKISRQLGNLEAQANQLANLGGIAELRDHLTTALALYIESQELFQRIGMPHRVEQLQGWIDELDTEGAE